MTVPRIAGKLGARPAVFPAALRDLTFYATRPLPVPPASFAVPKVADWNMDGNDTYSDCGVAGLNHLLMAAAFGPGETETFPTSDQVVQYYLAYTGGQDTGVVLSDFLSYVHSKGFFGHTVSAYAPVKVHDVNTLKTAVYLYDAVYTGITVTQAMMDAFQDGKPWDSTAVAGEPIGGHCVPAVGYSDEGLTVVTWGSTQLITWAAWHTISSEAWAVLPGELANGDGHGINLAALQADLGKLECPAPTPAPAHPGLLADLATLIRDVEADAGRDASELLAFLREHHL